MDEQNFTAEVQQRRLERLQRKAQQLEALGDEEERLNMSDEDAPVMRHKNRRIVPSCHHQSAVDVTYGVVCAVQSTQNGDQPKDLLPLVDTAKENTGGEHEKILADSRFCDYETLQKVEEQRGEDFYLPDQRFEASKDQNNEPPAYPPERFQREEDGGLRCPEGHPMRHQRTVNHEDGHQVHIYEGTACEGCPSHDRCTRGKKRTVQVGSPGVFPGHHGGEALQRCGAGSLHETTGSFRTASRGRSEEQRLDAAPLERIGQGAG